MYYISCNYNIQKIPNFIYLLQGKPWSWYVDQNLTWLWLILDPCFSISTQEIHKKDKSRNKPILFTQCYLIVISTYMNQKTVVVTLCANIYHLNTRGRPEQLVTALDYSTGNRAHVYESIYICCTYIWLILSLSSSSDKFRKTWFCYQFQSSWGLFWWIKFWLKDVGPVEVWNWLVWFVDWVIFGSILTVFAEKDGRRMSITWMVVKGILMRKFSSLHCAVFMILG